MKACRDAPTSTDKMSKSRIRIIKEMGGMGRKGKFTPKNYWKYRGNPTNIVFRSSWELDFMRYLDNNEEIVEWQSEEIVIPYKDPLRGNRRRYFCDFWIKRKDGTCSMVEIKPYRQTQEPKNRSSKKSYIHEVTTYLVNQAKWRAAEQYCKDRGWSFEVITEKQLYGK